MFSTISTGCLRMLEKAKGTSKKFLLSTNSMLDELKFSLSLVSQISYTVACVLNLFLNETKLGWPLPPFL